MVNCQELGGVGGAQCIQNFSHEEMKLLKKCTYCICIAASSVYFKFAKRVISFGFCKESI